MEISQASVFDCEERLSKALDIVLKEGSVAFVSKEGRLFGIIDDRNISGGFSDVSKVKCGNACVKCPSISQGVKIAELLDAFLAGHFKFLPVVDAKERVVGAVSRSDLLCELSRLKLMPKGQVSLYMKSPVHSIEGSRTIGEAKTLMKKEDVHHVVVTDKSMILGVISTFDFIGLMASQKERQSFQFISEVKDFNSRRVSDIARNYVSVKAGATLDEAAMAMVGKRESSVLILEGMKPIGILSAMDIFKNVRKSMEKKIDVLIGGLSEDTLIYHEALKAGVLGIVSKFDKSFAIGRMSLQVKETKSVFTLHFYFDMDGKFQTVSCEGHTIIEALAVLSKHLKALFEKAKSEKMDKKKVEIREVDG